MQVIDEKLTVKKEDLNEHNCYDRLTIDLQGYIVEK